MISLTIDLEFSLLIPPMRDKEFALLEESILAEGVRDPLVVWRGIIVDGHNRWRIIQEHNKPEEVRPTIIYQVRDLNLPDRDSVKVWIMRNQLGRRNITAFDKARMIESIEKILSEQAAERKKQAGKHGKEGGRGKKKEAKLLPTNSGEGFTDKHSGEVARQLAKEAGVGYNTLRKAKAVLKKADPATVEQVSKGEKSIEAAYREVVPAKPEKAKIKKAKSENKLFYADEELIDRDIRPCPFCGSPAQIEISTTTEMKKDAPMHFDPQVRCLGEECGLVWQLWGPGDTDSFLLLEDAREAMRAKWNRRSAEFSMGGDRLMCFEDAKPDCPFCGGSAKVLIYEYKTNFGEAVYQGKVLCRKDWQICGLDFEDSEFHDTLNEAKESILDRWGRRVQQ